MLRVQLLILLLSCFLSANAQSPFVVYKASRGVILQSFNKGKMIETKDPVRGTPVFNEDKFELKDERYFIKIKDNKGEIYSHSGKGTISPIDIVNQQKYNLFDRFLNLLLNTSKELGFNVTPVHTTQCVTHKGGKDASVDNNIDSISNAIATMIAEDIYESNYFQGVDIKRYYYDDESYHYLIKNNDSSEYAFVLYTVSKDSIYKHDEVIIQDDEYIRPSKIEFFPLCHNSMIPLNYITMSSVGEEDYRTGYLILFKRSDIYEDVESSIWDYKRFINWEIIEKELFYQGNIDRVLLIRR